MQLESLTFSANRPAASPALLRLRTNYDTAFPAGPEWQAAAGIEQE